MKKIMLTLVLLMSVICGAMAQNDAVYVYRNDGEFNAFLKADIDSMVCSHYDVDSVFHAEWQMQVVYTADSIYRIPLETIDSISFVTPKTIYQDNIYHITDYHLPYIKSCDESKVTFLSSFATSELPNKGQIVISDVYEKPLEFGFAGRVVDIVADGDSINVICEEVAITDIYKQLVCVTRTYLVDDETMQSSKKKARRDFSLGTVNASVGPVSVSDKVTGYVDGVCNINPFTHPFVTVLVKHRHDMTLKFSLSQSGSIEKVGFVPGFLTIPTGIPGLYAKIQGGGFYNVSGSVGLNVTIPSSITYCTGLRWNEKVFEPINYIDQPLSHGDVHTSFELNGSVSFGLAARLSIGAVSENVLGANVTFTVGPKLSANFSLSDAGLDDGTLYSSIKDTKVSFGIASKLSAGYTLAGKEGQFEHKKVPLSLNWNAEIGSWYLLPNFVNMKVEETRGGKATLSADVSRDLFFLVPPLNVGMALFDKNNKKLQTEYNSVSYHSEKEWPFKNLSTTFENLEAGKVYKCSPVIKFMGFDMVAAPNKEFTLSDCPAHITNFKQTGSQYSKGAYSNDGRTYDYKYEVATTVEIESLDGVSEWGYAYKDPYDNVKRIPLTEYGTSHTDTRYAYYRNESKSTACLYGYVKYEGDDEYYYGEPHDYPLEYAVHSCPDSNHPHAIDLGLPSGTKWCCMNVGASSPEQPGGYYAWGEVYEKGVYNEVTYRYALGRDTDDDGWYDENMSYQNIGSDIAGTSYDVAYVRMGTPWKMSSLAQQKELMAECTREFTQKNGMNGFLMTGKNGWQIFLPAAGWRNGSSLYDAGYNGSYWSSTQGEYYSVDAKDLNFYTGCWGRYYSLYYGLSIRAVCP